jgi:hypothetical protein
VIRPRPWGNLAGMAHRAAVLGLLAAILLAWPAPARAGRIVVLQFEGDGPAAQARLSLVRALLDVEGLTMVPQRDYVSEASAVGVGPNDLATPSGVRRAAAISAVDGVVAGQMLRRGNAFQVRILYFDGHGEELLSRAYDLVRGEMRADDLGRLTRFIQEKAGTTAPPVATAPPADAPRDPDPWPADPPPEAAPSDPIAAAEPPPREVTVRDPPPAPELGGTDWARRDPVAPPPRRRADTGEAVRPVISIRVVAGGGNRQYQMEGPRSSVAYATVGLFPEIGFAAEGFPLRGQGRFLEGLGFEGGFSHGFLASRFVVSGTPINLDTPVRRMHLDGRWRMRLSADSPMAPELGLRAGVGISEFEARVVNAAFTGVRHTGPRIGLEAAQPLAPPWLRAEAWLVALPMSAPGAAEIQAYGAVARGVGWAARFGLSGGMQPIARGINWSAWVERQILNTRFEGVGTRDDGGESSETYIAVHAAVGWAI